MPPMKLGGSKWRPLGATVVFNGTCVVVEWTVDDSVVEELVVLDIVVVEVDVVLVGTSVLLLVVFGVMVAPANK